MIIGFTGTRLGWTDPQAATVERLLRLYRDHGTDEFRYGQCIGADTQAAKLARLLGYRIIAHPPVTQIMVGDAANDVVLTRKSYLTRNRDIVSCSHRMIAVPWEKEMPPPSDGGGTWFTIHHAISRQKPIEIVWPDGHSTATKDHRQWRDDRDSKTGLMVFK